MFLQFFRKWLLFLWIACGLMTMGSFGIIGTANAVGSSFYTWPSAPSGNVGITRPTIQMKVTFDGLELITYSMKVNGNSVPVHFDPKTSRFSYTPAQDLAAGTYQVNFRFQFKGYMDKEYNWSFSVVPQAAVASSLFSPEQMEALKSVNDIRRMLGLTEVTLNPKLNLAAHAHANYQNKLGDITHEETVTNEGFTGETLLQRINYFNYNNDSAAEDISQQSNASPTEAIDDLFDAPYHRIPFLDPDLQEIGYRREGDYHVILFGFTENVGGPQMVVAPADGEQGTAVGWNGHEIPDPLRIHVGSHYPVGYPIMAGVYGSNVKNVSIVSAMIYDKDGEPLDMMQNNPLGLNRDNKLSREVILIPSEPLSPGSTYHVDLQLKVIYQNDSSTLIKKEWDFTTETTAGTGREQLHSTSSDQIANTPTAGMHTVAFGLDNPYFTLDGNQIKMVTQPEIKDGYSYLAIRDLEKALGAHVEWNDKLKAAIYTKNNRTIIFYINQFNYQLNGVLASTDTPAWLSKKDPDNPRTMVPVRLLSNLLGCAVDYDETTRTVSISY